MLVKLLQHTPEPETLVASAAKVCYSPNGIEQSASTADIQQYLEILMSYHHESPLEHVTFTFGIEGISRACSHQLVRHRIASYSQKSQRYVSEDAFSYVTPPSIENNPYAKTTYDQLMQEIGDAYRAIKSLLAMAACREDASTTEIKAAQKVAQEDARFVLPNACTTSIVVTMNARSLLNFFRLRCCNRAQWEIRAVADEMLRQCREVAPTLFAKAGPACVSGACSEGAMSCGHPRTQG